MSRLAHLLNTSAEVYREERSPDGMGGYVTAWQPAGVVRARFSQPSVTEQVLAGQAGDSRTHLVYLLPTAGVRRGDQLRLGTDVYLVLKTLQPSVPGTYLRADCLFREPGN